MASGRENEEHSEKEKDISDLTAQMKISTTCNNTSDSMGKKNPQIDKNDIESTVPSPIQEDSDLQDPGEMPPSPKRAVVSRTLVLPLKNKSSSPPSDEIKNISYYYHLQCHMVLIEDQRIVKIHIGSHHSESWKKWKKSLKQAISEINKAAPGLNLQEIQAPAICENNKAAPSYIYIYPGSGGKIMIDNCTTYGKISDRSEVTIYLSSIWPSDDMKSTSVHELLHALGFEHEHQRPDVKKYLTSPKLKPEDDPTQYDFEKDYIPITFFDPYSIMLYEENESKNFCRRHERGVWSTKKGDKSKNTELSELDKVGLNIIYPPVANSEYKPVQDEVTGMYYCQREVMKDHNRRLPPLVSHCEPGGPNCPACRTKCPPKGIGKRWQGWSGFVYCGKVRSGKTCGPHNGLPCEKCSKLIKFKLPE